MNKELCIKVGKRNNSNYIFVLGIQISMQYSVRIEDFPAVFMKIQVFLEVTPCNLSLKWRQHVRPKY